MKKEVFAGILVLLPTAILYLMEVVTGIYYIATDIIIPVPKFEIILVVYLLISFMMALSSFLFFGKEWFFRSLIMIPAGICVWIMTKIVFFFLFITFGENLSI